MLFNSIVFNEIERIERDLSVDCRLTGIVDKMYSRSSGEPLHFYRYKPYNRDTVLAFTLLTYSYSLQYNVVSLSAINISVVFNDVHDSFDEVDRGKKSQ